MIIDDTANIIKPLLIKENHLPSEVRNHSRLIADELSDQIGQQLPENNRILFVFVLRGAMLLYPVFAEKFADAAFCFSYLETHTALNCRNYDTVIIVDTVIETGKTVISTKGLMENSGISSKEWFVAAACANKSVREKLSDSFDSVFCTEFMDNVRVTIDAGEYATRGDKV